MPRSEADYAGKPFLKWAGGKRALVDRILEQLPKAGRRYIEPFIGSGAVFCRADYERYLLADVNPDLIGLYRVLQAQGERFIEACRPLFAPANNREEVYYRLRDEFNACDDPFRRSQLFVYLNRFGYNGLCRYNRSGGFNVPFGSYRKPRYPEVEMRSFLAKVRQAELRVSDFAEVLAEAGKGDVVYCDPPYQPLSKTASFTAYAAGGFGEAAQERLAMLAAQAAARGATVLVSNHDVPQISEWYTREGAMISCFQVRRSISRGERNPAGELLALFEPPRRTRRSPAPRGGRRRAPAGC